jgi:hypothetical protein
LADFRPAGWSGDADVRPVGWVTDQPGVRIRRRRSPVLLALGAVLVVGSAVAMAVSIVGLAASEGYDQADVVAEGVVAPLGEDVESVATFTAGGSDPFTVWIRTDGIHEENHRENVIAATACTATLGQGSDGGEGPRFQGNRQGTAVTIGDDSTVGWFTAAEGTVTVACHQEPFGRARTRGWFTDDHDFVVVRGKPSAPWGSVIVLTVAVVGLIAGIALLARWHRGRIVTVD